METNTDTAKTTDDPTTDDPPASHLYTYPILLNVHDTAPTSGTLGKAALPCCGGTNDRKVSTGTFQARLCERGLIDTAEDRPIAKVGRDG